MENLDLQTQITNLGKLFVKELTLEPGVDTFSKWMAHYIAEKMVMAENSTGIEKNNMEKVCFETILKLWEHRWTIPHDQRPFSDFEPILDLLEKINPDNDQEYYPRVILNRYYPELENKIPLNSDWVNVSTEIDRVARIWIEYCIKKAVDEIDSEKAKDWIENAQKMPNSDDVRIINILINTQSKEVSEEEALNEYEIKRLKKRIDELEKFKKLNNQIIKEYKKELNQYQT